MPRTPYWLDAVKHLREVEEQALKSLEAAAIKFKPDNVVLRARLRAAAKRFTKAQDARLLMAEAMKDAPPFG